MKLKLLVSAILLLETRSDQEKWDSFSLGEKLKRLNNLGVIDIDGCHLKERRYGDPIKSDSDIVYFTNPRLSLVLKNEIEKLKAGFEEQSMIIKSNSDAEKASKTWNGKSMEDDLRLTKKIEALKSEENATTVIKEIDEKVENAKSAVSRKSKKASAPSKKSQKIGIKVKSSSINSLGYDDIDKDTEE